MKIDLKRQIAIVEPKLTMASLVQETLKYGLIPKVVPEFKQITVGGAISGAALESSSFKYGQFSDAVQEVEVILGDGSLITASKETNSDLFYALFGAYGSLGLITKVTLELTPATPWVEITLAPLNTLEDLFEDPSVDFLEGLALGPEKRVKIAGNMVNKRGNSPLYQLNKPWAPWFYQVVKKLHKRGQTRALLPLYDYLFRYDRGAFWMGRFFSPTKDPSSFFRWLYGWNLSSKALYKKLHRLPKRFSQRLFFIHDFYLPLKKAEGAYHKLQAHFDQYPVWFCPVKGTLTPQIFAPHFGREHWVNLGFYGRNPKKGLTPFFEEEVFKLGGRKMLYSHVSYNKKTFEKIYDMEAYEKLRKKYFANQAFVSIYEKIINLV